MIKFYRSSKPTPVLEPFPSFGFQASDGSWRIQVAGWAYYPYTPTLKKRWVIRMLAGVMHASPEDVESERFKTRIFKFMSDGSPGHEVYFRMDQFLRKLGRKNRRNGHFRDWVWVPNELVESNRVDDVAGRTKLPFQIETDDDTIAPVQSHTYLLANEGVSVISDIDDTIKVSDCSDRRKLLANTFLNPFESVSGMADLYQGWFQRGVDFHYVSSSPWQLHGPLKELQTIGGFPAGSIHLRNFRLRRDMLERALKIRRHGKSTSIKSLFQTFPKRKFILIGDSGEKDPETYRKICKKNVHQVAGVFIRDMEHKPIDDERLEKVRNSLPGVQCERFETSEQLCKYVEPLLQGQLVHTP